MIGPAGPKKKKSEDQAFSERNKSSLRRGVTKYDVEDMTSIRRRCGIEGHSINVAFWSFS